MPLLPQAIFQGLMLEFDFPALQIGIVEYPEGPTGCTVFIFADRVVTSIDMRGGGAGTVGIYERNHAICFAGGSLPGLEGCRLEFIWSRRYDGGIVLL